MAESLRPWPDGALTITATGYSLVSPKPIVTTATKQAEISTPERFVTTKRQIHTLTSYNQERVIISDSTSSIKTSHYEEYYSEKSETSIMGTFQPIDKPVSSDNQGQKKRAKLSLQTDNTSGVRFVLGDDDEPICSVTKQPLATHVETLANNVGIFPTSVNQGAEANQNTHNIRPSHLNLTQIKRIENPIEKSLSPSLRRELMSNGSLKRRKQHGSLERTTPIQPQQKAHLCPEGLVLEAIQRNTPSGEERLLRDDDVGLYSEESDAYTPSLDTPLTQGLVNPGFVFEFTNKSEQEEPEEKIKSPSLLDVMHKKYWSNSPNSSLTRPEKSTREQHSPNKSKFRSKHYSYCQVVDQNSELSYTASTLPIHSGQTGIKMFGDVSHMFNTMPLTKGENSNIDEANLSNDHSQDSIGTDFLTVPETITERQRSKTPPNISTEQPTSVKLVRKFSLSPKILRKKIIARLKEYSPSPSSVSLEIGSDTETEDSSPQTQAKPVKEKKIKDGSSKRKEVEIEALDACVWLKEAGFPQYVQLFEDSQFPIELDQVGKDHSFLSEQQLHSLYRRVKILNKSVHMKLDINSRKQYGGCEDDEEDNCVLSDKWQLERASGRWSHIDTTQHPIHNKGLIRSFSSRDSIMTDDSTEDETMETSPVLQTRTSPDSRNLTIHISHSQQAFSDDSSVSPHSPKALHNNNNTPFIQDKKTPKGSFLSRVSSLRRHSKKRSTEQKPAVPSCVTISGPTLVNTPEMTEKMQRLGCVDINGQITRNNNRLVRSASADDSYYFDSSSIHSNMADYLLPEDYIMGTFPKQLIFSSRKNSLSSNDRVAELRNQQKQAMNNRISIYDNVPEEILTPTPKVDLCQGHVSEVQTARKQLDAVLLDLLNNITTLSLEEGLTDSLYPYPTSNTANTHPHEDINLDSAIVSPLSEDLSSLDASHHSLSCSTTPIDTPELHRPTRQTSSQNDINDLTGSRDDIQETIWRTRERRDSGVGSSLTREPLESRKKTKIRWHSFVASHRPSFDSKKQHISHLSASHLMYLKRLALVKVTSLMEQYSPVHKSGFTLIMHRFIKKGSRTPDYTDKTLFGVPLQVVLQRTGQPLPQCILHAMRYLRKSAADSVGIFRKSGVKSRIQKLRNDLEEDPDNYMIFESMQAYDVADMFKTYLRELPECLLTNKLSDTFLAIFQHLPSELRMEALQACVLLLPDESREVLESVLCFLSDMAGFHEQNQMTASNLAMCFAPSLFNIHNRGQNRSPKSDRKNTGIPDQKEFLDQAAATDCLTLMINESKQVFTLSDDFMSKCSLSYMEAGEPARLALLGSDGDYSIHIDSCIQGLLKETKEKGWTSMTLLPVHTNKNVEVSYKKVHDGSPLRLWKTSTDIDASADDVLNRILNERHKWDEDLTKWRSIEKLDKCVDVHQYMCNSMPPHPATEFVTLRAWRTGLAKGACALVSHSIDYDSKPLGESIRGIILASRYLLEPLSDTKCKVTHISRIDTKGRCAKWYNRSYGYLCANNLLKVKDSFEKPCTNVHETKV